jgi:predicted phage terminase large subunit-like protein
VNKKFYLESQLHLEELHRRALARAREVEAEDAPSLDETGSWPSPVSVRPPEAESIAPTSDDAKVEPPTATFHTGDVERMLHSSQHRRQHVSESPNPPADVERYVAPFDDWLREVSPTFRWDWPHLMFMRTQLERVTKGEIRKLMIFSPPRHGKSEQNTVRYSSWRLEKDPATRVIIGAHTQPLAVKFARKSRRLCLGRIAISPERNAAHDWETAAGGGVRAVGVGTAVTGLGADLILIDDPVKSREEADSETYREKVWDWYTDDLYTRQEPGAAIVLTMTRWHEDDLAGRILASLDAPNWTVINLPALAEENDPLGRLPGAALCPDRFDERALEEIKQVQGHSFFALYQGRPVASSGGRFRKSWFRYWEPAGDGWVWLRRGEGRQDRVGLRDCRRFATVDSAVSLKTSADFSVIAIWAVTTARDLILLDRLRDRWDDPAAVSGAVAVFESWRAKGLPLAYFGVEANGVGKSRAQNMRARGLPVREIHVHVDKIARSATAVVRIEAGQVFWPSSAPWLVDWEAEHLSFPFGKHDDQVDTTSLAASDVYAYTGCWSATGPVSVIIPERKDYTGRGPEDLNPFNPSSRPGEPSTDTERPPSWREHLFGSDRRPRYGRW